jgi:hypothetical protein
MHPSVNMIIAGAVGVLIGGLLVGLTRAGRILGLLLFVGGAALLVHRFTSPGSERYTLYVVGPPGTQVTAKGDSAVVSPAGWIRMRVHSWDSDPITVRGGKSSCEVKAGTNVVLLDGARPVVVTRHDYNYISNDPPDQTLSAPGCYQQAYRVLDFNEEVPTTIMIRGGYAESLVKLSFAAVAP